MQTHRADMVELTVLWDRSDYKRFFWISGDRATLRIDAVGVAVLLAIAAYMFARSFTQAAVMTGIFAAGQVCVAAYKRTMRMRRLPDHFFGPHTYRIDEEGFHCLEPFLRSSVPWIAIKATKVQEGFLRMDTVGCSWFLPLRTLTDADKAALQAVCSHYGVPTS